MDKIQATGVSIMNQHSNFSSARMQSEINEKEQDPKILQEKLMETLKANIKKFYLMKKEEKMFNYKGIPT